MADQARGRGIRLALSSALLLATAAAGAGAVPELLAGPPAEAILVLPLNVVTQMPPELAPSSAIIWEDLTGYLQDRGKRLKTAKMSDARSLWRASIRRAREEKGASQAGFEEALAYLSQALAEHADFASVVVPSLLLREAAVVDRRAEWDGVSRSVEFRADSLETRKLALLMRFEGLAPAASLHVVILDSAGRKLQETTRGLELIAAVRVVEDPREPFVYENHRDLFGDQAAVRESIAQALAPFVPAPDPARE